eukprot:Platyproteum_vivax@DN3388_c0_g1_i1.p1
MEYQLPAMNTYGKERFFFVHCVFEVPFPIMAIKLEGSEYHWGSRYATRICIMNKNNEIFQCQMFSEPAKKRFQSVKFGPESALIKNFCVEQGDTIRIKYMPSHHGGFIRL